MSLRRLTLLNLPAPVIALQLGRYLRRHRPPDGVRRFLERVIVACAGRRYPPVFGRSDGGRLVMEALVAMKRRDHWAPWCVEEEQNRGAMEHARRMALLEQAS